MSTDDTAPRPKSRCNYFIGDASAVECGRCGFPQVDHRNWPHRELEHRPDPPASPAVDQATTDLFEPAFEPLPAHPYLWELDSLEEDLREEAAAAVKAEADAAAQAEPAPPPKETTLRFRTGRELAETTSKAVQWIVELLVVVGALTEVVGKIKTAGKTTFALLMCRAVLSGETFLGRPTAKGPVVYLTEQPDASFRVAAEKAGVLGRDDFVLLSWYDRGASWEETVAAAVAKAREIGAALLVVDTLSRWAGIVDENDAGAAMKAYAPLKDAAGKDGLAGLLLRHARKGGGEIGEAGRGSSGFSGEADILVDLRRIDGKQVSPNRRQLEILGRFGDQVQLVIELTPDGYRNLGTHDEVDTTAAASLVLRVLPASGDEAQTVPQLRDEVNSDEKLKPKVTADAVRMALNRLHDDKEVQRKGAGKKGNPYLYWRGDHE